MYLGHKQYLEDIVVPWLISKLFIRIVATLQMQPSSLFARNMESLWRQKALTQINT